METTNDRDQRAQALALDILTLTRSTLLVKFRFLDRALSRLQPVPSEKVWLGSDGEFLYFEPWYILGQYKAEQTVLNRDLLHSLLHCIFFHSFVGHEIHQLRWDLACDMAVECVIHSLKEPLLSAKRCRDQVATVALLQEELGKPTAERIYQWLGEKDFSDEELQKQRQLFFADQHGLWYGSAVEHADVDKQLNLRKLWEEVSRRMQTELEMLQKNDDSLLVQTLRSLHRPRISYTEFLRRFGIHGEVMQLSDEEFDTHFYLYGLELYGNIPLIEPLEYREQKRIRDFIIAIDTSGSVRGDMVQSFIQHTHDILLQQENFFTKINLHILQCDDRIREDAHITSREEFDLFLKSMELKGFGRTDFRPVFTYVEELQKKGLLTDLRGLIYFTDGEGIYPAIRPPYDTAFILHQTEYREPQVPAWAIHLCLTEDEILERKFGTH